MKKCRTFSRVLSPPARLLQRCGEVRWGQPLFWLGSGRVGCGGNSSRMVYGVIMTVLQKLVENDRLSGSYGGGGEAEGTRILRKITQHTNGKEDIT